MALSDKRGTKGQTRLFVMEGLLLCCIWDAE